MGVVFTSLKAESRAHENSHAAEMNPYHEKNNREKYNHVLEFFYKLTKSESGEESLIREAADWLFVLRGQTIEFSWWFKALCLTFKVISKLAERIMGNVGERPLANRQNIAAHIF